MPKSPPKVRYPPAPRRAKPRALTIPRPQLSRPPSSTPGPRPPRAERSLLPHPRGGQRGKAQQHVFGSDQSSILDLVDNLLNKGVVINGEFIIALADVDLIYLRLSALFCAADRVL